MASILLIFPLIFVYLGRNDNSNSVKHFSSIRPKSHQINTLHQYNQILKPNEIDMFAFL